MWKKVKSKYAVRTLGYSDIGQITLTEEDREAHVHILGAPGEGKSKFLEMMVSMDIDALISGNKAGACFIDSTGNGQTMKKVLNYCIKKGFEKVCVIDPHDISEYGFVSCINPIDYNAPPEPIEAHIMDSMRILWQTKDFSDEAIIRKYLPKVIRSLHAAKMTLPDTECMTIPEFHNQRQVILDCDELDLPTKLTLNRVFRKIPSSDWMDFQSTCRRLDPFFHSTMKLMLGSRTGLDFKKLIADGWIILVNLYPGGVFGEEHQRLLGTVIFNEIVRALERLTNKGYHVPYYVYIDEFGYYATRKIANIIDHKRHFGLRLTMAHQRFDQIEDKSVLSAVRSTKAKLLFYTSNKSDRDQMIKDMGYGGELPLEQVSYVLGQTKKQEAVIRIGKQPPTKMRLRDWPDVDIPSKTVESFLQKLYSNAEHYKPKAEVMAEIRSRFVPKGRTTPSRAGKPDKGDNKPKEGEVSANTATGSYTPSPDVGTAHDSNPASGSVSVQPQWGTKKADITKKR